MLLFIVIITIDFPYHYLPHKVYIDNGVLATNCTSSIKLFHHIDVYIYIYVLQEVATIISTFKIDFSVLHGRKYDTNNKTVSVSNVIPTNLRHMNFLCRKSSPSTIITMSRNINEIPILPWNTSYKLLVGFILFISCVCF